MTVITYLPGIRGIGGADMKLQLPAPAIEKARSKIVSVHIGG